MLLLHASVEDGRLLLWGESPPARRGRNPRAPHPQSPPFDPGADALTAALPDGSEPSFPAEQRFLWLPTIEDRPIPSSALIAEPPEPGATPVLAPWRITVLPV